MCADTLHRFCKKEHDWGWKKFMELSKVLEGFTVEDTLIIKAQVQVIRCAARPHSRVPLLPSSPVQSTGSASTAQRRLAVCCTAARHVRASRCTSKTHHDVVIVP